MNRRDFLKTVTTTCVAAAIPALPVIAAIKWELKFRRFTDKFDYGHITGIGVESFDSLGRRFRSAGKFHTSGWEECSDSDKEHFWKILEGEVTRAMQRAA